jgi:hypothetical protein
MRRRLVNCACFTDHKLLKIDPCRCHHSSRAPPTALRSLSHCRLRQANFSPASLVVGRGGVAAIDGVPLPHFISRSSCEATSGRAASCRTPLALHPLKQPAAHLAWWAYYLDAREPANPIRPTPWRLGS